MADVTNTTTYAGHIVRLKVGGQEIGRAQSIDGRRSFGQEGQYEIGSIMPQEHTPLRFEGSVSVEKYKIRRKSLKALGLASLGEGILYMNVIDIEVTDRFTGEIDVVYRGCSLNENSENHRANAISGENATWVYLSSDNGTTETI